MEKTENTPVTTAPAATSSAPKAQAAQSNDNVIAAIATIPLVGLIMYYAMPTASPLVKHYAKQSNFLLAVSLINMIISGILSFVFIGLCTGTIIGIASLILWIVQVVKALQGEKYMTPVVGEFFDTVI